MDDEKKVDVNAETAWCVEAAKRLVQAAEKEGGPAGLDVAIRALGLVKDALYLAREVNGAAAK